MSGYRLTSQAEEDLLEAWLYIARDNEPAANRVLDEVYEALERLGAMPGMGRIRENLAPDLSLRSWPVHSYLIIYRADPDPLEIVRTVSGFRDISALFN